MINKWITLKLGLKCVQAFNFNNNNIQLTQKIMMKKIKDKKLKDNS